MQPLENCIGPTIRMGREILCLPYAGFLTKRNAWELDVQCCSEIQD